MPLPLMKNELVYKYNLSRASASRAAITMRRIKPAVGLELSLSLVEKEQN